MVVLENSFGFKRNIVRGRAWTRYRVGAALVKRVAAAQTFQAQPDASSGAVYFDRFAHILGAGRIEPAGGG